MKEQPEQSDNELIALFVKDESFMRKRNWHRDNWKDMPFDTSWDWLMPVVEKINDADDYSCIHIVHDCVFLHFRGDLPLKDFRKKEIPIFIDRVYMAAVEFIKWYNQQDHGTKES